MAEDIETLKKGIDELKVICEDALRQRDEAELKTLELAGLIKQLKAFIPKIKEGESVMEIAMKLMPQLMDQNEQSPLKNTLAQIFLKVNEALTDEEGN